MVGTGDLLANKIAATLPSVGAEQTRPQVCDSESACHVGLNKNESKLMAKVDAILTDAKKDGELNGISWKKVAALLPLPTAKDNVEYGLSLLRIWLRSPGCRTAWHHAESKADILALSHERLIAMDNDIQNRLTQLGLQLPPPINPLGIVPDDCDLGRRLFVSQAWAVQGR